jgi:hypothetical protein
MTGVEILATEEIATSFDFNWESLWLAVGICMVACVAIGSIISLVTGDTVGIFVFATIGVLASAMFGPIAGDADKTPTEYETHYKVTITDEVSMNDFLAKYEILDHEGKIYTVRERND